MPTRVTLRGLLLSTVLSAPFATGATAQTIEINEDELASKSQQCQQLARLIQDRGEPVTAVPAEDVVSAINEDRSEDCGTYQQQIASAGPDDQTGDEAQEQQASDQQQQTEEQQEQAQVTEQVDVSEEATIEGQATVTVPDPNVDVQVPPPEVQVTEQQPQIDVIQDPTQIEMQQERPRISVEIPEIVVRVEIPAPQLYVLQPDPNVEVSDTDPQVEVSQADPQVTVTQPDPNLDVELGVDVGGQDEGDMQGDGSGGQDMASGGQQAGGNVTTSGGDAQVEIVQAEGEPQTSFESGDPSLSFQSAEPEVTVMMAEQPTIEIERTGEPTITVETAEEREQRRQQRAEAEQQSAQPEGQDTAQANQAQAEGDQAQAGTDQAQMEGDQQQEQQADAMPTGQDAEQQAAEAGASDAEGWMMTVSELMNMAVITADGEDLGAPEGFIEINGQPNMILSSGGFLGIGATETPVPLSRVLVEGEQLVVQTMTEDEIEAADNFEYDSNVLMPEDAEVRIGS